MKNPTLISRLTPVSIREVWKGEATDFTPWLARDENIEILGEELGMKLVVRGIEERLGNFVADIVCEDGNDGQTVLIENQTAPSDHRHLGQICTYAGQLQAQKIIWICERVRDEHREAIDWLNDISDESHSFFAVEIQAWRIGQSPPAPKFEVLAQPASLTRKTQKIVKSLGDEAGSSSKSRYQAYWSRFIQLGQTTLRGLAQRQPYTQTWQTVLSRSTYDDAYFEFNAVASPNVVRAECYIGGPNSSLMFDALQIHRDQIERKFGSVLEWKSMRSNNRIALYLDGATIDHGEGMDRQCIWLADNLAKLIPIIIEVADDLDLEDFHSDVNEDQ